MNCLREFHLIYNFGAVGGKNELIRFRREKVKGQGRSETTYTSSQRSTLGDIFFPISGMCGRILMKLMTHDTDDICKVIMSCRPLTTLSKNHFPSGGGSPSKTI